MVGTMSATPTKITMNEYGCGVIRVRSTSQSQTNTGLHCRQPGKLQSFHLRFISVNPWPGFLMRDRDSTRPFVFFFLVLPYGISSGFVSITLPFVLTRVGFSVPLAASIVAMCRQISGDFSGDRSRT